MKDKKEEEVGRAKFKKNLGIIAIIIGSILIPAGPTISIYAIKLSLINSQYFLMWIFLIVAVLLSLSGIILGFTSIDIKLGKIGFILNAAAIFLTFLASIIYLFI